MKYEPISCLHGVLLCWLSVFASDAAFEPSLANLGKAFGNGADEFVLNAQRDCDVRGTMRLRTRGSREAAAVWRDNGFASSDSVGRGIARATQAVSTSSRDRHHRRGSLVAPAEPPPASALHQAANEFRYSVP